MNLRIGLYEIDNDGYIEKPILVADLMAEFKDDNEIMKESLTSQGNKNVKSLLSNFILSKMTEKDNKDEKVK